MEFYQIFATRLVELKELRFPYPLVWDPVRGTHSLFTSEHGELVKRAGKVFVTTETAFDLQMIPDTSGAVTGRLVLDVGEGGGVDQPDWVALAVALRNARGGIGLALARNMFRVPWFDWGLERVARELGTPRRGLQMALFRESYSFSATLRRCRRLNALLRHGDGQCTFTALRSANSDALASSAAWENPDA